MAAPKAFGDACVSDETAFFALYEELGLNAGCSLEDLKHAYRRRASQLHPDRVGADTDMQRLQRLNVLYDSALEFHQTYGRLPGTRQLPRPAAPSEPETVESATAHESATTQAGRSRRWLLIGVCLMALLLYWLGLGMRNGNAPTLDPAGPGDQVAPGLFKPQAPALALGMDAALARSILGKPDEEGADRWDYGPSWVEFQCGKVVGWYSSPLRPLRVERDSARSSEAGAGLPNCMQRDDGVRNAR